MELTNFATAIPEDEPKMRIYENYIVFNSAAVKLLDITDGDYIQLFASASGRINGKAFLYIGKGTSIYGYAVRRRMHTMRVNSRVLSRKLREHLDGCGCYRICPDDTQVDDGKIRYNIFFRNYDKANTD